MIHITFLIPYPELAEVVKGVFADHPRSAEITYTLQVVKTNDQPSAADFPGADVVIARGFTARKLSRDRSLLLVELQNTGYDVLLAATECIRRHGARKIGVVGTFSMIYGSDAMADVFPGVQIVSRTIEEVNRLNELLEDLKGQGCDAVLGGRAVSEAAPRLGLRYVMLKTGKEAIGAAIDEALRVVEIHRTEKRRSDSIAAIMNYTMEGIIATDPEGRITMMNQFARALCRPGGASPIGQPLRDCLPGLPPPEALKTDQPMVGEICMFGDAMLVVNVVPLMEHAAVTGYVLTFQRGPQIQEMEDKIRKKLNPKGFVARYSFANILGKSRAIADAKRLAERFAKSEANILIMGETGSGKEFFAQSIHNASGRARGPFVAVNCAALPEHLLESELFGYVEGAFTGAAKGGKMGLFELAHNGTIFLDEIGDIAPVLQARLLRVIQEREIIRLGHDRITPIDVRIISATNKNIYRQVEEGSYRSDLLYRLEVLKLRIPPLRDRISDLPAIAESFFQNARLSHNTRLVMLNDEALAELQKLPWPGNVRELRNFCERLAALTDHQIATKTDVLQAMGGLHAESSDIYQPRSLTKNLPEKERILELLAVHNGSRKAVAAAMGIDASTLWRKMKRYALAQR